MSWQDIVKKIPIPKETEGNYRGKEPATAEGRYGPQDNSPEAIAREMEERRKEYEEEGVPMMNQYPEKDILEPIKALYDKLKMRSNTLLNMNEKLAADELFDAITELKAMEKEIVKTLEKLK